MMGFWILKRKQLTVYILSAAVIVLVFMTAVRGVTPNDTSSSQRLIPIYSVGREEDDKILSISFDAAWGNEDTGQLIEILGKYNIKATFFVVGDWVEKYPESVKQLHDAGHEIMNHSDTHPHMSKLTREQMCAEIESCNDKIEEITGVRPTLFRAPYGEYCNELIEVLDGLSMYCVQWDVDSLDWKDLSAGDITGRVCSKVCPGSIVLFHNAALNTPEALPSIIDDLLAKGYTFVPISQNIYTDQYTIDHEGKQWQSGS